MPEDNVSPMNLKRALKRAVQSSTPLATQRHLAYFACHHRLAYIPGITKPKTYTAKVHWRMLNDRRDELRPIYDKLWMKEYALRRGVDAPATLWSGVDLSELEEVSKSFGSWVLKPNHLSGHIHFHEGSAPLSTLRHEAEWWLGARHAPDAGEWATQHARPLVIAEQVIEPQANGDLPDYKFFVFDGRPVVVLVISGRFTGATTQTLYRLPEWEPLDVIVDQYPMASSEGAPREMSQLMEAAASLGAGWDFMRIDLYAARDRVWLGELTPYPGSAKTKFIPSSFDAELGREWHLQELG